MTENVDPLEIAKFNEHANMWWDLKGQYGALHAINPYRMKYIQQRVSLSGKSIVDIGCGGGILTESLAKAGATTTGIDMSSEPLSVAKEHAQSQGLEINYQQIPAETLALNAAGQFDVVCCMEMLEHVPNPQSVINACRTLLKPNGHLFLSTLNRTPKAWALAIVGAEYILNWVPKGTHTYDRFIKPSEMADMCNQAQLTFLDVSGITFNPLLKKWRLSRDTDINYLAHCQPL